MENVSPQSSDKGSAEGIGRTETVQVGEFFLEADHPGLGRQSVLTQAELRGSGRTDPTLLSLFLLHSAHLHFLSSGKPCNWDSLISAASCYQGWVKLLGLVFMSLVH